MVWYDRSRFFLPQWYLVQIWFAVLSVIILSSKKKTRKYFDKYIIIIATNCHMLLQLLSPSHPFHFHFLSISLDDDVVLYVCLTPSK